MNTESINRIDRMSEEELEIILERLINAFDESHSEYESRYIDAQIDLVISYQAKVMGDRYQFQPPTAREEERTMYVLSAKLRLPKMCQSCQSRLWCPEIWHSICPK